jgi:hypothetical protein
MQVDSVRNVVVPRRSAPSGHCDGVVYSPAKDFLACRCLLDRTHDSQLHMPDSLKPIMRPDTGEPWTIPLYRYNHRQFLRQLPSAMQCRLWLLRSGHILKATAVTASRIRHLVETGGYPDDLALDHDELTILCICGSCTHVAEDGIQQDYKLGDVQALVRAMRNRRRRIFMRVHGPGSTNARKMEVRWDAEWAAAFAKVPPPPPFPSPPLPSPPLQTPQIVFHLSPNMPQTVFPCSNSPNRLPLPEQPKPSQFSGTMRFLTFHPISSAS